MQTLGDIHTRGHIAVTLIVSAIVTFMVARVFGSSPATRDVILAIAYFPTATALCAAIVALLGLLVTFRAGRLRKYLVVLATALTVYLVQSFMWGALGIPPTDAVARLLAVEAYLLIGAAQGVEQAL